MRRIADMLNGYGDTSQRNSSELQMNPSSADVSLDEECLGTWETTLLSMWS